MNLRTMWTTSFFGLLFFLPIQTVLLLREPSIDGEKWQYGVIGIYATDILLLFALVAFAVPRIFSGQRFSWEGLRAKLCLTEKILLIFLLWAGFSIFWASDTLLAGYFFLKLLLACGVFFLARSLNETEAGRGITILVAAAALQAMLAAWQFLSQTSFASMLLGVSAHESWTAGTAVLKNESGRWLRGYGTLPHPNMLGGFLGSMLVLLLGYRSSRLRAGMLIIVALIFVGVIFSFSRSAWLGVGIGYFLLFSYACKKNEKDMRRGLVAISSLLVFLGLGLFFLLPETIAPRFESATIARERSMSDRLASFFDAKSLIISHPIAGVGAGNFTTYIITGDPIRPLWGVQPAHNVFLLIFAELGIIGLGLFVLFLLSLLQKLLRENRDQNGAHALTRRHKATLAFAIIALFPSLFFDHWLWTSHFGLFFLFLLLGLLSKSKKAAST